LGRASGRLPIFGLLRSLGLPAGHYAVFGSGPLAVQSIIAEPSDLDVLCRGPAWEAALSLGPLVTLTEHGISVVSLFGGTITLGTSWAIGDFDTDLLIDTAEIIDGLPFVRLEHVVAYKRLARRPKDLEHLDSLARHQAAALPTGPTTVMPPGGAADRPAK
jgi:hypothetical protein